MTYTRTLTAIGATAVLVGSAAITSSAAAQSSGQQSGSYQDSNDHGTAMPGHRPCYSNLKQDAFELVLSEHFASQDHTYDTAAADQMVLKRKCTVRSVYADGGYFRGSGAAVNETVTIYADDSGLPGSVISTQTVAGTDTNGQYDIPLTPVRLKPGTYWVSVVSNQAFTGGGQWGWERTTAAKNGDAVFSNPGGNWGTGCDSWTDLITCEGGDAGDLRLQVRR